MPDFNKGDFTQQGVAGHVNANLRLNEKRLVSIDLTSNEEAEGCTITGTVTDLLNDKVYNIGSGGGGGGSDFKKTTLTLLNTSEDSVDMSSFFTEAINYFVYVEIDGKQAPRTAYNSQFSILDIVDYLKSLSISPGNTIVIELYYCYLYSSRAMSALGCVSNIGTSLVNMTWDSDHSEYLINDITADSAITIDVNDLPK